MLHLWSVVLIQLGSPALRRVGAAAASTSSGKHGSKRLNVWMLVHLTYSSVSLSSLPSSHNILCFPYCESYVCLYSYVRGSQLLSAWFFQWSGDTPGMWEYKHSHTHTHTHTHTQTHSHTHTHADTHSLTHMHTLTLTHTHTHTPRHAHAYTHIIARWSNSNIYNHYHNIL